MADKTDKKKERCPADQAGRTTEGDQEAWALHQQALAKRRTHSTVVGDALLWHWTS